MSPGSKAPRPAAAATPTSWSLPSASVSVSSIDVAEQLQEESLPVHINTEQGTPLPLFKSTAVTVITSSTGATGPPAAAAAAQPAAKKRKHAGTATADEHAADDAPQTIIYSIDSVFYVGGAAWRTHWCPLPPAAAALLPSQRPPEVLAVAVHPKTHQRNRMGRALSGPGHIQLWSVPTMGCPDTEPQGAPLPSCLAAIPHEGAVAWDIKWCPDPSAFLGPPGRGSSSSSSAFADAGVWPQHTPAGSVPIQGILAAVLGNGDTRVWLVPSSAYLQHAAVQQSATAGSSSSARPPPAAAAAAIAKPMLAGVSPGCLVTLSGATHMLGSLPSCIEWWPEPPHDKLLMGCWDGRVAIWQLPLSPGTAPQLLLHASVATCPVRCIKWRPPLALLSPGSQAATDAAASSSPDSSSSSRTMCFLTGTEAGDIQVWDAADTQQPLLQRLHTRMAVNACAWTARPETIVTAMANGELRQTSLDLGMIAASSALKRTPNYNHLGEMPNCLWALDVWEGAAVLAYTGESGVVGLATVEPMSSDFRAKRPHVALGAMVVEKGEAWLLRHDQLENNGGLPVGGRAAQRSVWKPGAGLLEPPNWLVLPHEAQVLYTLAFSRTAAPSGGSVLLASGGAAGLVRVQRVAAAVPGRSDRPYRKRGGAGEVEEDEEEQEEAL